MFKKIARIFSSCLPICLCLSCSSFAQAHEIKEKKTVKITYDFAYQIIKSEELKDYFSNFENDTLFYVTIRNFDYYNIDKTFYSKGYLKTGQINNKTYWSGLNWPGEEEKINIQQWILKMFYLSPHSIVE